jgi:hypothetical protein
MKCVNFFPLQDIRSYQITYCQPGMVAHACDSQDSGGGCRWIAIIARPCLKKQKQKSLTSIVVKNIKLGDRCTCIQISAQILSTRVTSGKLLTLLKSQFTHQQSGDTKTFTQWT